MSLRNLISSAVTLASIPFAAGLLAWHGALRSADLAIDIDPLEVDRQLWDRNDDARMSRP